MLTPRVFSAALAFTLLSLLFLGEVDSALVKAFSITRPHHRTTKLFASSPSNSKSCEQNCYSDERLIQMTKEYLENPSPDYWSDDFVFRGPVIGPLAKKDLINTLTAVGPSDAFEDFTMNTFGFSVDPIEPNRVWYMVRPRGVFAKPYQHPTMGEIAPTGKAMIAPPESRSVRWDENGKIEYQTVGYVTDRFTGDTTGGMGAVFGMMHHFGIDMDGSVGSPFMRFIQWLSSRVLPDGTIPKSYSMEEDIPAWWTDKRRGADA